MQQHRFMRDATMFDIFRAPFFLLLLLACHAINPVCAEQAEASTVAATQESGRVATGYFRAVEAAPLVSQSEDDASMALWLLLAAAGIGLGSYWLGRRSTAPAVIVEPPPAGYRASGAKAAVRRNGHRYDENGPRCCVPLNQATIVTVDEMASVEEEAEEFLLLGRMDLAIGVLRHHIESHENAPAHVWMKLLEVLHVQGLRKEFDKLAFEIKERFNVALPTWENANIRSNDLNGLENFPHLLSKITAQWRQPDCLDYLHGLTRDNRNGERSGFHPEAFRELLLLIGVQEQVKTQLDTV